MSTSTIGGTARKTPRQPKKVLVTPPSFESCPRDSPRFRAACALSALRLSHEHTIIMLHDYWHAPNGASGKIAPHHRLKPSRAHYNTTLGKWYDHVLRQGTLAVLRPRPGAVAAAKAGAWGFERLREESERDPA